MHSSRRFIINALTAATCLAATPLLAQSPDLDGRIDGQTHTAILSGQARLIGHHDAARTLRLAIVLASPHAQEEHRFLEQLQDKASPGFHRFLSAEESIARFSPSAEAEEAVIAWARSKGLTITHRFDNRLVVDVEAPVTTIERALQVRINDYQLPAGYGTADARVAFANDRDPVLPASLRPSVMAVLGLNSISVMTPAISKGHYLAGPDYVAGPVVADHGSVRADATADAATIDASRVMRSLGVAPGVAAPPAGFFTPSDMFASSGYDYGALMNLGHCCNPAHVSTGSPPNTSIGIAAFGDVSFNDVSNFQAAFSYLAYNISKIGIDGGYSCGANDINCNETTGDTEWALATANSQGSWSDTAAVYVYEGPNSLASTVADVYNQMLTDGHARTFSTSWSGPEGTGYTNSEMDTIDSILSKMVAQGWTLLGDSGDQGATGNCDKNLVVRFPASDPNVVGVGGTRIARGATAAGYEIAWTGSTAKGSCSGNNGGSTGGFSNHFKAPGFQSGMGFTYRAVPDMALDAWTGHDVFFNGAWEGFAGTSVATPMLAGFFAQDNAYLLSIGNDCRLSSSGQCSPIGNANYPLYWQGKGPNGGHNPYYDIVSGCNTNDITVANKLAGYCASAGFDEVTGWGSANMLQLAWAINWELATPNGIPYVSFSGPTTGRWYNSSQSVRWTIVDYLGTTGGTPTGIAGFTQGWDAIPGDAYGEPNQINSGSGDSFYAGPQYPNRPTGCLSLVSGAGGCAGGVPQGCHTAHVRGWNNMGWSTGDAAYGPICYDTQAPSSSLATALNLNLSVTFTLSASDPGSSSGSGAGVSRIYYSIDNSACSSTATASCLTYASPFTISQIGSHTVRYFSSDGAGNFEGVKSYTLTVL